MRVAPCGVILRLWVFLAMYNLAWKVSTFVNSDSMTDAVTDSPLINVMRCLTSSKPGVASVLSYRKWWQKPRPTCDVQPRALITLNVLLLCGDVQSNPGPRQSSIYPCAYCQLHVGWENSGINCDNCEIWFHRSCADLSTSEYNRLSEISTEWRCYRCNMVNQSSSHYHSYELECKNSFDVLSDATVTHSFSSTSSSCFSPKVFSTPTADGVQRRPPLGIP